MSEDPVVYRATPDFSKSARIVWLDLVRVLACFLVILCHSTEAYIPGDGVFSMDAGAALFFSGTRACVPLFVMISGALLLPMRERPERFLKRRLTRVLFPLVIWGIVLALLPLPGAESAWAPSNVLKEMVVAGNLSSTVYNIVMLPVNFTDTNIHFWFLYIILGLYLFTPIISPWVKQASIKGLAGFLALWGFTLFLPYLKNWPGHPLFPELHGQCDWNTHEMTYYFGGYLGYFILGHFLMRLRGGSRSKVFLLGASLFVLGWVATHLGFMVTVGDRVTSKDLEFFIDFLSPNVALMTIGVFLMCRALPLSTSLHGLLMHLSALSFGIFLIHYWVLTWLREWLLADLIDQISSGFAVLLLGVATFAISWLIAWGISQLPGRKWTLG